MDESVLDTLCGYLDLKKKHIFHSEAPLDLSFFSKIRDLLRNQKELFYDKYTPQIPADINMSEVYETGGRKRPLPVLPI